jgi:formylglycine-generating enzyme required for sulfatase activity
VKGIDVATRDGARRALPRLRRIAASAGDRLPILSRQARAHHVLKEFDEAVAGYGKWLRLAPPDHAERKKMALGLYKAQSRKALGPEIGAVFKDCDVCPEMVVVPAGSFTMGSPPSETGRYDDEGPQHRVTIAKAFAVGKFEVTFAEWDACVAGGGCDGYRPGDQGWGRGRRPVINVSWKDAKAYVGWLSRKTGKRYRLLTEAEWEYAARAGTTTPFHFGATISTGQANYDGNYVYGSGRKGEYRQRTIPVGGFASNRFGLHDVHGNVREWTEDCWNKSYSGAPSNGSAWTSGECARRVLRGGSWYYKPRLLRSAYRNWNGAGYRSYIIGFRVARTL